ncbi:MAG: hypothetical protein IMZ55_13260 [Acidobacteria bacterium]|nr:hypothetical protein [Acidobacteriota bacterium]
MGNNPLNASAISGVGFLNVVPYSNFQGPMAGGFCNGPRGRPDDSMEADLEGTIQWSTGEYWMVPLANALLALAGLIPAGVLPSKKLGAR